MLLTDLSTGFIVFIALATVFCVVLWYWVYTLADYCRSAAEFVLNQNKSSVSLRRIAELEATLTDLLDSYHALLTSHKKLRSRIGMRKLRETRENGVDSDTPPADEAGRASYKAKLRNKLKSEGRL